MTAATPKTAGVAVIALLLVGCATAPAGPTLQALPGSRMTLAQFTADDAQCRDAAVARLGGLTPADAANQNAAAATVAGTAIGAMAGALFDGHSGAAVGAGMGLLYGATVGAGTSHGVYAVAQQQFDALYFTCMYGSGHKVPVPAHDVARQRAVYDSARAPMVRAGLPQPPADVPPADYRPPSTPPSPPPPPR